MKRPLVLLAILFVTVAATCVPSPDHRVTTQIGGLSKPWGLDVDPAGQIWFTERDLARVSVQLSSGEVRVVGAPTGVATNGEGGLLGLALDPAFADNRRLYVCFSSTDSDVRVARFVVSPSFDALTERIDIVFGIPYSTGRHSGCQVKFGPDGYLWITTGDAAIGTTPQDLQSLGGKVLRVDADGVAAPSNPFIGDAGADDRIYTYGHRNPQGIGFDPDTGSAYSVEHGPDRDDEINLLVAGGNYGWNPVPGYNESVPMTDTAALPDARVAAWSSGLPTIAPGGAAFVDGEQWTSWDGGLAVAVLKDRQLRVHQFNDDETVVESFAPALLGTGLRIRNVAQGADGVLLVATDVGGGGGAILRIDPA